MTSPSSHILSPRADLLLILGSPLLALALVFGLATRWPSESIWALVITFGAVGHHLPGFLRTYGDKALFARFRWRFLLAPPLFFTLSYTLAEHNLHGLLWISLMWSIWHGMMQHFGFMRIYDAKRGVPHEAFARADYWLTLSAFGACLVWSPEQGASVLDGLYTCGVSPLAPESVAVLRKGALVAFALALAYYLFNTQRQHALGFHHARMKIVLLASTLSVVLVARVFTADPFISVAVFEVLHDVQYLAIVWAFERRRREKSKSTDAGGWLVSSLPLYIGVCLAYGALAWGLHRGGGEFEGRNLLVAFLATSALLHYYYDGFIWKVRSQDTQSALDLKSRPQDRPQDKALATQARDRSGLVQGAAFGVACIAMVAIEAQGQGATSFQQAKALANAIPHSATARRNYAAQLISTGQLQEALPHLEAAAGRLPKDVELRVLLFDALLANGRLKEARGELKVAARLNPRLRGLHHRRGQLALRLGEFQAASVALEFAINEGTPDARLLNDLGFAYLQLGELARAGQSFQAAIGVDRRHAGAWLNLGLVQARSGELDASIISLRQAIALNPTLAQAHNSLGGALMMAGRRDEAIASFERALALNPDFAPARHNLERARRQR